MKHIKNFKSFNESHEVDVMDDLKANFRSWEIDHDNKEDADGLLGILMDRHPKEKEEYLKELAYSWVGYEETNEASKSFEGKGAKFHVNGTLKDWIFIYDEPNKEIGCEFSGDDEEVDKVEADKNCNKIFKSIQHSDKGERPIQMLYKPCKGIEWKDFVKGLEEAFDRACKE